MTNLDTNRLFKASYSLLESTTAALKPKLTFDLGANDGGWINNWLQNGSVVHAFEPVPDMCAALRDKYGSDPRVVIIQKGISDHQRTVPNLTVYYTWMLLPVAGERWRAKNYVLKPGFTVEFTTLDAYCSQNGIVPDFVKMDIDGYELRALRGGASMFRKHRPPIYFEYSYLPRHLGDSIEEMCRLIYELGYRAVSSDGGFIAPDWQTMLHYFPEHHSFDIMLMPA